MTYDPPTEYDPEADDEDADQAARELAVVREAWRRRFGEEPPEDVDVHDLKPALEESLAQNIRAAIRGLRAHPTASRNEVVKLIEYVANPAPESRLVALAAAEEMLRVALLADFNRQMGGQE